MWTLTDQRRTGLLWAACLMPSVQTPKSPPNMALRFLPFALLLLTGCASSELTGVRDDLARQLPDAGIAEGRTFSFGAISLGTARLFSGLAGDDAETARMVLRGVRRVQVGRYDVTGSPDASQLTMPYRLRHYVARGGWTHLASVRQDGEAVWVLYRARGERITDLFVTALTEDELVLARVSGDLSGIVLRLLEQRELPWPVRDVDDPQEDIRSAAAVEPE